MSLELAELQKIYVSNKYSPTMFFLNPFTQILFTSSWVWPQEYIAQKKHTVKKVHSSNDNLKEKIKEWFQALDLESQLNCLTIKDKQFIDTFRYFLEQYCPDNIYNMKSRRFMEDFETQTNHSTIQKGMDIILKNLQIAFLKQPLMHLSKNAQKFLSNELIKWMEIISHNKMFQFANKYFLQQKRLKQTQFYEDNMLWFSENSFQKLQCYLVNQFEKSIQKSYFNRDRIQSNYLLDIKEFCKADKDNLKNKNIETQLLNYPIQTTMNLSEKQIVLKMKQLKEIQQKYEKEKEKMFHRLLEEQIQGNFNDVGSKKRRKRVRKKGKIQGPQNDQQQISKGKEQIQRNSKQKQKELAKMQLSNKFQIRQEDIKEKQQDKIEMTFSDEMSQIQKFQDSGYHQTDVTIQKYFENQEKGNIEIDFQVVIAAKRQNSSDQKQKNQTKINQQLPVIQDLSMNIASNQSPSQTANKQNSDLKYKQGKQKKRTKKQKMIQNLHTNLIRSTRNGAFTEFIDTISIQSNNLYNYKLSAYQFIVFFVSSLLPTTNITLFGSNAVGLSLASSDIDIMISNMRWSNISEVRQVLYHIGNEISKMGWVVDFRLILNAKVPVLKLLIDPKIDYFQMSPLKYASQTHLRQSIVIKADIIINIQGEQNIGCESTLLMKDWLTDHPQLQRIILFFKYVLWYYGLNENYRGGICSYCLFLMIVGCLFKKALSNGQKQDDFFEELEAEDQDTYIIEVLKYYSQTFDPKVDEITITKETKHGKSLQNQKQRQESNILKRTLNLRVVDPINGQYVESSFSKFGEVRQLFSMILVESMRSDDGLKRYLNSNEQINEQFSKFYQSMSQPSNIYNVITKNMEQANDSKMKKIVKKLSTKLKKSDDVKYSVKDIVSIGFKIGIQNWMMSPGNNSNEQKFWI